MRLVIDSCDTGTLPNRTLFSCIRYHRRILNSVTRGAAEGRNAQPAPYVYRCSAHELLRCKQNPGSVCARPCACTCVRVCVYVACRVRVRVHAMCMLVCSLCMCVRVRACTCSIYAIDISVCSHSHLSVLNCVLGTGEYLGSVITLEFAGANLWARRFVMKTVFP